MAEEPIAYLEVSQIVPGTGWIRLITIPVMKNDNWDNSIPAKDQLNGLRDALIEKMSESENMYFTNEGMAVLIQPKVGPVKMRLIKINIPNEPGLEFDEDGGIVVN